MLVKKFKNQTEIVAGDNCILRQLLNLSADKNVEARYSLAWAKVPIGAKTWLHTMKTTEVYFIIKGHGMMCIDDEQKEVGAYDTVYIPPGASQCIENIGAEELEFICIVDPAWKKEDEIIL